jgi:HD-GYP domain-containing protein (c-di-GMP phosphodiesterase class II)
VEGQAFKSGEPFLLARDRNVRTDVALPSPSAASVSSWRGEAMLCVPLQERNLLTAEAMRVGVLALRHMQPGAHFSASDCRRAQLAAGLIASALANAHTFAEHRGVVLSMLKEVVTNLENKYPQSVNHSHRVAEVCTLLAAELRLDTAIFPSLHIGAMLHDIGKIGVTGSILNKPGNLTEEELTLLKRYPIIGYEMCKPLDLGDDVLLLIRNHAEKLDGTGYPDGLRQGQIPIPLRILCVADAFDAMSSYRPYRKAMSARERREQLNRFAGTQFDPMVVEALKSLLNDSRLDALYHDQWQQGAELQELLNAQPVAEAA